MIPYSLHTTTLTAPPVTTIKSLDSLIKTGIKEILHLPMCTPDSLLYCRKRDGGLGIPKLENTSVCTSLKLATRLIDTADPTTQAILTLTNFDQRLGRLAKSIRLPWPNLSEQNINAHKKRQKAVGLKCGANYHQQVNRSPHLPMTHTETAGYTIQHCSSPAVS
jgi:hypothetical protein